MNEFTNEYLIDGIDYSISRKKSEFNKQLICQIFNIKLNTLNMELELKQFYLDYVKSMKMKDLEKLFLNKVPKKYKSKNGHTINKYCFNFKLVENLPTLNNL